MQMTTLAAQNVIGPQTLKRVPEPEQIMTGKRNVDEFDEIINSNIAISFCGALELLFKIGALPRAEKILDLACGPWALQLVSAKYRHRQKSDRRRFIRADAGKSLSKCGEDGPV